MTRNRKTTEYQKSRKIKKPEGSDDRELTEHMKRIGMNIISRVDVTVRDSNTGELVSGNPHINEMAHFWYAFTSATL